MQWSINALSVALPEPLVATTFTMVVLAVFCRKVIPPVALPDMVQTGAVVNAGENETLYEPVPVRLQPDNPEFA